MSDDWDAVFANYTPHWNLMKDGPADKALRLVIELANDAPDEMHRVAIAVALMEPLVDIHWQQLLPDLRIALAQHESLRSVLRSSDLDVPDEVEDELRALLE